jgi:hypothetical protein
MGDEPQHAVSPIPGILCLPAPERDEWADSNFFICEPSQAGHLGVWWEDVTSISFISPQSWHK